MMGIGADFETRYNEEQTLNYNSKTRNDCSSHSGGARIFGFGKQTSSSECTALSNTGTTGDNTIVKNFVSTTYGTLIQAENLSSWGAKVSKTDVKDLDPLPIQQDLQLITDIFQTKAVKDITHNHGPKVNVTEVQKKVIKGFRNYCKHFESECGIPSCAATLSLKTSSRHYIFEDNGRNYEGRPTFQDKISSNYLYYSQSKWNIGPNFTTNAAIFATSECPHQGSIFEGVTESPPTFPNILSWLKCSQMCLNSKPPSQCRYWQYDADTKRCTLINDYSKMVPTTSNIYTGTRDCPGDMFQYAYGQCAENFVSRSMWEKQDKEPSEQGFLKDLEIKNFDPTSIVTAGGQIKYEGKDKSNKVDVMFQNDCHPPPLPGQFLLASILALTPGGVLLKCGGADGKTGSKDCYSLDAVSGVWSYHSSLRQPRWLGAVAITLPSGTYIFGGNDQVPTTSDHLPASENSWIPGFEIDNKPSCGVKVSDTEVLLISAFSVNKYSGLDGSSVVRKHTMPDLDHKTSFEFTSCARIGNNVIVVSKDLKTQIIPLSNYQPRFADGNNVKLPVDAKLITVGGRNPRLLTIGGVYLTYVPPITVPLKYTLTEDVYEWDEVKEQWWKTALKFRNNRYFQAALAVPPGSVCNMN